MVTISEIKAQLTIQQMNTAQELGIGVRTLYEWRQNRSFLLYQSYIADTRLDQFMPTAIAKLQESIEGRSNNGIPSMKALELYFKLSGRLIDRKEIVRSDAPRSLGRSNEEIERDLEELDKLLQ
ncbi:TPA: hypothetical protein VBX77_001769 [Yersinia enterocolitica]|nr:hypothetical protein [Yersinia enterocolitica]